MMKQRCKPGDSFGAHLHPVVGKPLPLEETPAARRKVLRPAMEETLETPNPA